MVDEISGVQQGDMYGKESGFRVEGRVIHVPCGDTVGAVLDRANFTLGAGGHHKDDRPVVVNVLGAKTEENSAMVTSASNEEKIKAGTAPGQTWVEC